MSSKEKSETKKKRGPGRPSKKQPPPVIEMHGIVDKPSDPVYRMEVVCQIPSSFKNLIVYFKKNKSDYIHLRCSREGLAFFTRGTESKTRIMAWAAGRNLALYHYKDATPFFCTLRRDIVEGMSNSINKSFNELQIRLRYDMLDKIIFVLRDPEIKKECSYEVTLCEHKPDLDLYEVEKLITEEELKKYPIEFTLGAKQLKKTIVDASNHQTDEIMLEKFGDAPLQLSHQIPGQQYYEIYRDPKKINLRSEIKSNGTFSAKLKIKNINAVANSMVTDMVKIYCRESGEIVFRSAIDDKALIVNAVVEKVGT